MRNGFFDENWRSIQAEHHARRARLLSAYAAAYESEINSAATPSQRRYLSRHARELRREAQRRADKSAEFLPHS